MNATANQRPLPPSAAFPPSAPPGAPPPEGGPPGKAPPFAGLLQEQSTARTAPAEGDKKKGPEATPTAPPAEWSAAPSEGAATPAEGQIVEGTPTEPTLALVAGEAAAVATVPPATTAPTPTAVAGEAAATAPTTAGPVPIVPTSLVEVPIEAAMTSDAAAAATAIADETTATPGRASGPTKPIVLPPSIAPTPHGDASPTSLPAAVASAGPEAEASFPAAPKAVGTLAPSPSRTAPPAGEADTPATETGGRGKGDEQVPEDLGRPAATPTSARTAPAPTPTPTPTPTGPNAVAGTAGPPAPAPAPATKVAFSSPFPTAPSPAAAVGVTLRMAGESGFTRARVTLRPAELGGVEVFLRQGSAGLTATVVAQTPQAAQMLETSATELQRRLAAQGLELSSLQISVGGESAGAAHGGRDRQGPATTAGGARGASSEAVAAVEQTQTIDLGGGVLVDVLA